MATFSLRNHPMMTTVWRVDPTPWGESGVHDSLTLAGNHFFMFSTMVIAADRGAGTNVEQFVKTCADRRAGLAGDRAL